MRALLLALLFSGIGISGSAQNLNFADGFEDGDFTENPAWQGDTTDFSIVTVDGNHLLRLAADGGGSSQLSTDSTGITGSWEFFIRLDFSPSGSNFAYIFLMSDTGDLQNGSPNGYAVRAGESGSGDVIRLVRFDDGVEAATVLSGTTDISAGGEYRVKVTRDTNGSWSLEVGSGYDGILSPEGGIQTDNTYTAGSHFGILLNYTSTRADRFFFDFKIDLPPLSVTGIQASGDSVRVTFNRDLNPSTVQTDDFFINNSIGIPSSLIFSASNSITLFTDNPLTSGKYTLSVDNLRDLNGQPIPPKTTEDFFVFAIAAPGDVIINEFMYDPPASLPEYVELKNRSGKLLNVQDWSLGDGSGLVTISTDTLAMDPNGFLVLTSDTASLESTLGDGPYVPLTTFPSLNNTGDAVYLSGRNGIQIDSLFYTSDWGGSNVALERKSARAPSIFRENWGDSPAPEKSTAGKPNLVEPDTTAPELEALNILSERSIELVFNERIEKAAAVHESAYHLSGVQSHSFNRISFSPPDTVRLEIDPELVNSERHRLRISGIPDIFGNTSGLIDTTFTFFKIMTPDSGSVIISEFLPDPPDGVTEFVELYNPSEFAFDLRNWTINDNTGNRSIITEESYILPPNEFIAIAPDPILESLFTGINLVVMGSRFPSLNNSGDDIVIRSANGTLQDSLRYRSNWSSQRNSLERRDISVPAFFRENWGHTAREIGTPGSPNTVERDDTPPEFLSLEAVDISTLRLLFSERLDSGTAGNLNNYRLEPGISISSVTSNTDTVIVHLSGTLESGTQYTVKVSNLADIFGNVLESAQRQFLFLEFGRPQRNDIVINEILYEKSAISNVEFIELYNNTENNFQLGDWRFEDRSASVVLPSNLVIRGHSYLVLTGNSSLGAALENGVFLSGFPSLNDNNERLVLKNASGIVIDSLVYSDRWGGGAGISLERIDPGAASADSSNWTGSSSSLGHTAGAENAEFNPDTDPPKPVFATVRDDNQLEVRFNEFVRLTPGLSFAVDGRKLNVKSYHKSRGNIITLDAPPDISGKNLTLTVEQLADVKGNILPSGSITITQPLTPGSVVINEIMYDPINDSRDNLPDQSEYIELRNIQNYAISLEGMYFHDAPDENGDIHPDRPVSTISKWIPAGGIALVHADTAANFRKSRTAQFFDINELDRASLMRYDGNSFGLKKESDRIFLSDSSGGTIDSVFYHNSWHNTNLIDTKGIALERIDPNSPGNDGSNWSSSTEEKGGTPGRKNSVFQVPDDRPRETGISFSPNPFSPDGDGFDDNLFINYNLGEPDFLVTVRIYDRYGRIVRTLADRKRAGFEGSLIWDGKTDDGKRNRIGIYIVLFEAYNGETGKRRTFKEVVVLARKF